MVGWVSFPRSGLTFTRGEPRIYVSSQKAHRGFCPSCGTQLLYQLEADPEWVDVTLVSLDEPEQILPEAHVWTSERLSWLQPGDTLPRHASDRERERE